MSHLQGVDAEQRPNCAVCAGYTNASWTLRAELSAEYVCRLLGHMGRRGYIQCVPRCAPNTVAARPLLPLTSGYIRRGSDTFLKQGLKAPWLLHQNYLLDLFSLRLAKLNDGVLEFANADESAPPGTSTRPGM